MLEEAHEGRVEGFVAGPEAGEGEDTFTADFLYHWLVMLSVYISYGKGIGAGVRHTSTLRKDNAQYISKSRKCNEDGEDSFGTSSEHITEESCSYNLFGADYICFWDGSKVRNL
jgi:hypothetical protein